MAEVHLEFGEHLTQRYELDEEYKKLEANDPSGSTWPEAVTARMLGYKPDVVVSDGLDYTYSFRELSETATTPEDLRTIAGLKVKTHAYLPPNLAKKLSKDILLIGGDTGFLGDTILGDSVDGTTLVPYLSALGIGAAAGASLSVVSRLDSRVQEKSHTGKSNPIDPLINPTETEPLKVNRRNFIAWGFAAGTLFNLGKLGSRVTASLPTHGLDWLHTFENASASLGPTSDIQRWVDGRSALLIQKAIEFSEGTGAVVSVVMGSAHIRNSSMYLEDEQKRIGAIRNLAGFMKDRTAVVSDTYTGMTMPERLKRVRNAIGRYSLINVDYQNVDDLAYFGVLTSDICQEIADSTIVQQ